MPTQRPDLLGSLSAWQPDGTFTEVAYFTSEEEAREAEARPVPTEMEHSWSEMQSAIEGIEYLDLRDPWLA